MDLRAPPRRGEGGRPMTYSEKAPGAGGGAAASLRAHDHAHRRSHAMTKTDADEVRRLIDTTPDAHPLLVRHVARSIDRALSSERAALVPSPGARRRAYGPPGRLCGPEFRAFGPGLVRRRAPFPVQSYREFRPSGGQTPLRFRRLSAARLACPTPLCGGVGLAVRALCPHRTDLLVVGMPWSACCVLLSPVRHVVARQLSKWPLACVF
jgi:hypothetical protein